VRLAVAGVVRDAAEVRRDLRHIVQEALEGRLGRCCNGFPVYRRDRARGIEIAALDTRTRDNNLLYRTTVPDLFFSLPILRVEDVTGQKRGDRRRQRGLLIDVH
jgi:hypothetical protein